MSDSGQVTTLLHAWVSGHDGALDRLLELLETQLRLMAHRYVGRRECAETLQATALVNEVFLRFIERVNRGDAEWRNRQHFLAHVALSMRSLLADRARARHVARRGGKGLHVNLDGFDVRDPRAARHALLYIALDRLAARLPAPHRAFIYRRVVGLTVNQTAALLGIHRTTVIAHVRLAAAFLRREIGRISEHDAL